MIDYTVLILKSVSLQDYIKFLERVDIEIPLESEKMIVFFEGLRVEYYPNIQQLKMRNSLHKFYNRVLADIKLDGNHNDFRLIDFKILASIFSELYFERSVNDFKLSTRFETGVNIDCGGYKPMDIIQRYESYQVGNTIVNFETMEPWGNSVGKPTVRKAFLSDYQLKFYNKSKEANLSKSNLMRFECIFGKVRKVRAVLGANEISLDTLCKWENWKLLGDNLVDTYSRIKKLPLINGEKMSIQEINMIHAVCSKNLKKDLSTHLSKHYYTKYLKDCKDVYEKISMSEDNFHQIIHEKISDKVKFLYTNQ